MAIKEPDYTYGLREKLKTQGTKLYPGMSADESFKTFVDSHYGSLTSESFPDGLTPGGSFVTDENITLPGPRDGFPGPPTGQTQKVLNKIEDVKYTPGKDGIPELNKITYIKPNGSRMVYDVKNNTSGYNNVVRQIEPGKSLNAQAAQDESTMNNSFPARVAGTLGSLFEGTFGPTAPGDFAEGFSPFDAIPGTTTVERQTLPFSSKWSPQENKLYQETGVIPTGRSPEDLNATGYKPWEDRSTLMNQVASGDQGLFGKVNLPANLRRQIVDNVQNQPDIGPEGDISLNMLGFSPNKTLQSGQLPYTTNEKTGIGYQNLPETRLMKPMENAPGDTAGDSIGKSFYNAGAAGVNFASGLGDFLTSAPGYLTLGAGGIAGGARAGLAATMEESGAAMAAVDSATTAAQREIAVQNAVKAKAAEASAALKSGAANGINTVMQGKFAYDMGHGVVQGFKETYNNLNEPVYDEQQKGYVGTRINAPAATTSIADMLTNGYFAGHIGYDAAKSGQYTVQPRTGAFDMVDNAPYVPNVEAIDRFNSGLVARPKIGPIEKRTLADEIINKQDGKKYQIVNPDFKSNRFEIPADVLEQIRQESRDPNNLMAGGTGRASRPKVKVDVEKDKNKDLRPGQDVKPGEQPLKPGDLPIEGQQKVNDAMAGIGGVVPRSPISLGEIPPSEPINSSVEQLSPRQPNVNPDVIKEASDKLNRALDVEDRDRANFESGIADGSMSEKLGNALLARSDRRVADAHRQFERDIGNEPGDKILPQTNQEPIKTQNVRNYQLPEKNGPAGVSIPNLPTGALEAAADPTKMAMSGETKSQFADRVVPELNGQQAFEKNGGRLSRLTFDQLKDLKNTTTADPNHNTRFVSRINEEMASRERKVADTYSPEQSGKNAITDNLKPELMTDAQLKDITDNHPSRIEEQKKIVSGHNRGDYKSPLGKRSAEGEQAIRELNKLKYQLSFAREEANKRVRVKAGIARPDGTRIVASQERKMNESRIDATTGEKIEPPKAKRDPMSAINHVRGRLDKLTRDELIAARDGLKAQGREYWKKVDEHIKGRDIESERVHKREYGSKSANMPNARVMSRTQLEERIAELPDEIKQAEERHAQTKSPEDLKSINEARGDLSAFRRELGHRDTMEAAPLEYEANKNVKQVSGDMPGVPSTPTQKPGVGPFKRDVSKPEVTPIEGRDPEIIRAEGAAAYEAEQQAEARTPKPPAGFTQGDSQNLHPKWDGRKLNTFGTIEGSKLQESGHKLKFSEHKWDPSAGEDGEGAFKTSIEIKDSDGNVVGKISFTSEGDKESTYLYNMEISGKPKIKQVLVEEARARSFMLEQRIETNDLAKMNRIHEDMQGLGSYAVDDFGIRQEPHIKLSSPTHFLTGEGSQLERDGYKNKFKMDKWDKNAGEDGEGEFITSIEVTKNGEVVGRISFTTETDKDSTYLHNVEITGDTPRIKRALVAEMNIRAYWNEMTIDDNGKKAMAKFNPEVMRPTRIEYLNKIKENAQRRLEKLRQGDSESLSRKDIEDLHRVAGSTWNQMTSNSGAKPEKGTKIVGENTRKSFVKNEAEYSNLSEGVRDVAYTVNEGQSTAADILNKIHLNGLRDPKISKEQATIAKLLMDTADKNSLSVMVGVKDTKYDRASSYRGAVSAALIGNEGPGVVRSVYGDIKMSRGHMMDQGDSINFILHEIVHATTVDKVNRAIFGISASIHTQDNILGESGQQYLDRLKAYVNDPSSDKSITKIARSYLKYLSTLKDESKPISWKKINEATGKDPSKNVIGNGADKDAPIQAGQYGALNIDEFITHAMTDKSFQAELRAIKMGQTSAWEVIKKSIAEMLGIAEGDTALAHTMDGVMELSTKDLSEINKPGLGYDNALADVRAERLKESGINETDALSQGMNEASNRSKYLEEGTMENQSVRSMKDIEADIRAAQRSGDTSNMGALIQERNAIMSDSGQVLRQHPFFKEAAKKLGFNASHDALLAEANYQQRIAKGDYNQRNNAADRRKFYERSKMSESSLGEELNQTKTQVRLEKERQRMSDMGVDWDSLPKELKALTDIGAIGAMEWEGTEMGDNYRTAQKMGILKGYGLKPEDVKQLRNDVDFKEYFNELENKGPETRSLEGKSEDSYNEDMGFEQDVSGMKKMGPVMSFTQSSNDSRAGQFFKEEKQAAVNAVQDVSEGFNNMRPKTMKEVKNLGIDIGTLGILRGSSAQLDVIAKRFNIPEVTNLRQLLMGNNAGEMDAAHGQGYHSAISAQNKVFQNKVVGILRPLEDTMKLLSTNEQRARYEEIGRAIVNPRRNGDPIIAEAVDKFRNLYRELYQYQRKAGIEMGNWGGTYVPRVLNTDSVLKNKDGFISAATKAYEQSGLKGDEAKKAAELWFDNILKNDEGFAADGQRFIFDAGSYNGEPKHTRDRVFSADAERAMEQFYNRNIMDSTFAYIGRAVKSSEISRRFGSEFQKYRDIQEKILQQGPEGEQILREVNGLVEGQLAPQRLSSPTGRVLTDVNSLYQSLRFLTNATLSSMSEPVVNAMRTGNVLDAITSMGDSVQYAYKNARNLAPDYHQKLAEDIGVVQSILSSSAMASSIESRYLDVNASRFTKAATNAFFRGTGLHQWTEGTRVAAVKVGEVFINRLAKDISDGGKPAQMSSRLLNELGVSDHKAMSKFVDKLNSMPEDMRLKAIMNQNSKVASEYRNALGKYAEQVIMNPNAGTRAKIGNHPLGSFLMGLQSYQYAFNENVVKRIYRMTVNEALLNKGNMGVAQRIAMLAPLMISPIFLAAQYGQGTIRDELFTDPARANDPELSLGTKLARAFSRAGGFGRYDLPINTVAGLKYKKDPATAFVGPTVSDVSGTVGEILRLLGEDNTPNTNTQERKGARTIYDSVIQPSVSLAASGLPGVTGRLASTAIHYGIKHPGTREAFVEDVAGPPVDPRADQRKKNAQNAIDKWLEN